MPDEPQIPIAPAETHPINDGGGPGGMMSRFNQLKETTVVEPPPVDVPPPAPSTEAPPADTPPAPETPEPPVEQPKERAKWGELKQKAQERDELVTTKLPAMEKELEDLRAKAAVAVDTSRYDKQIAEKEQALADYERRMAVYDIRESKPFKDEVMAPLSKIGQDMDRLAATYKVSPQALKDALTIGDPAEQRERLDELMADFDPIHKAKVWGTVDKTQEIYQRAAELEKNAQEVKKELDWMQSQETEKQKAERSKTLEVARESVKKQFLEHLPLLKDEAVASDVFGAETTDDPTMTVYNAMAGKALVHVVKENRAKDARIKELETELAARGNLSPKAGGGSQTAAAPSAPVAVEGENAWQRFQRAKAAGAI